MKNNKKIISEINRVHELMGVKSNVLNEQAGVIDNIIKKVAPDVFKVVDSPIAKAYRKMADETMDVAERKQAMEEFIRLSKKEMPELYAQIRRIALNDSEIKSVIDNLFTTEQKQTFSENVERLLKEGDTDEEVMSKYQNSINRSDLTQSERAALEQRMRDEISTIRTRLVDSGEIAPLSDDAASTNIRVTSDDVADDTAKAGDDVADDTAKAGDDVADDTAKAGDDVADDSNQFTTEEVVDSDLTIEELTSRKMEDIPNLTDKEIKTITKETKWFDFISKIKKGNTFTDIFTKQVKLVDQSQKIINELLNNKNIGSVTKRNLEARLNRNMLSIANFKGNTAYMDFYRWADDLFSSSTDRNVRRWWDKTKKKDGFVIMSELEKRGSLSSQFGKGFKDGWKSMSESTKDFYIRARQVLSPVRGTKRFSNFVAKLRGKNPPFKMTDATEAQKKAFSRYFWTGNRTAYSGFSKYMAENGATAAFARAVGQFGRGYIIATAVFTVAEVILKGGFDKGEGFESFKDLVWFAFKEYWNNIIGLKYAVPAYTIGKPAVDLVATIVWSFLMKSQDTFEEISKWWDENAPEWWSQNYENISNEVNDVLNGNSNNTDEVPTEGDESETGDEGIEVPGSQTGSSEITNTLDGLSIQMGYPKDAMSPQTYNGTGEIEIWGMKFAYNSTDKKFEQK